MQFKHRFPFIFLTANRTVVKAKAFSVFNFDREPYRTEIWSVYRFFNGKNGKIDDFWFGTVRAFCKKSKNGTLFGTVRLVV